MNESNGTEERDRLSRVFPMSNGSENEFDERNGNAAGFKLSHQEDGRALSSGRGKNVRRITIGVVIVVLLITCGWFAVIARSTTEAATPTTPRVLAVQTISVEPVSSYQVARKYTGTIVARRTSHLGFELAGKLEKIYFDEGDSITAGIALAKLDTEHLVTKRRQVVARQAQAAAKLDEMMKGPRDEDIASARARVESLLAQVELLRLQTARHERLFAKDAISRDEYEQYAFGLKARKAQLNESKHDLEELLNGTRKEQITAQRAVVEELMAVIEDIDVDLRKSTLKAPFEGTIARRLADEGTVMPLGQPIFRLVEDQALEAWIGLPVEAAAQLTEDSMQRMKIGSRYYHATVAGRFPEIDTTTRTRTVVLKLDNAATQYVVHGQIARLQLEETVENSGYWLPVTALTKGARGLWTSYVAVEMVDSTRSGLFRVERRDIEVLHTESNRVLVRGTLNSGDLVIEGGIHRVVPGQLVRLAQ